jgi:hypothetical protein
MTVGLHAGIAFGAAQAAEFQLLQLSNRVRFIMAVINGTLRVANRKKAEVEADLAAQGFDRLPSRAASDSKRKASPKPPMQAYSIHWSLSFKSCHSQ